MCKTAVLIQFNYNNNNNQCWLSLNTISFLSLPEILHLLRQVVAHKLVEFMEVDLFGEGHPLHLIHVSIKW